MSKREDKPDRRDTERVIRELEAKIARLQRERSVYSTKSRLLAEELEFYRSREERQDTTVDKLLERQHELNVMLNRSHMMLARAQDAASSLSLEFNELARALPEPGQSTAEMKPEEIEERVSRINDLFKQTGKLSEEIAETLDETSGLGTRKKKHTRQTEASETETAAAPEQETSKHGLFAFASHHTDSAAAAPAAPTPAESAAAPAADPPAEPVVAEPAAVEAAAEPEPVLVAEDSVQEAETIEAITPPEPEPPAAVEIQPAEIVEAEPVAESLQTAAEPLDEVETVEAVVAEAEPLVEAVQEPIIEAMTASTVAPEEPAQPEANEPPLTAEYTEEEEEDFDEPFTLEAGEFEIDPTGAEFAFDSEVATADASEDELEDSEEAEDIPKEDGRDEADTVSADGEVPGPRPETGEPVSEAEEYLDALVAAQEAADADAASRRGVLGRIRSAFRR